MILPIPVPPKSGEDAVKFIDLSDHQDFFGKRTASTARKNSEAAQSGHPRASDRDRLGIPRCHSALSDNVHKLR